MKLLNSPTQNITYKNQSFLVKRDDLLDSDFSGNKARKLYYFLKNDFKNIDIIISYGSNQSNAMYSLSVLCKLKGWKFIYYMDHIPSYLKQNPNGNFAFALQNGMEIKIGDWQKEQKSKNKLFISEGGAIQEAKYGIEILANEILEYKKQHSIKSLNIFLPSGTGTTALFLQKYLKDKVLTCPCVGDSEYLKKQFLQLESDTSKHPSIITPDRKYHFGKLYRDNFLLWQEIKRTTKIEFDLLYDPVGLKTFLNLKKEKDVLYLYIHQGGLKGNETMIERYLYRYKDLKMDK